MDNSFLSQEEIDALLNQNNQETIPPGNQETENTLTAQEQDILCEIGNISAGASSTALSEILRQRVMINVPTISFTTFKEFHKSFETPYLFVEVNYTSGLEGKNIFILKIEDAVVIADLMMEGNGENVAPELDEMGESAVSEAMNQMIGLSATSMSQIFNRRIEISPPVIRAVFLDENQFDFYENIDEDIVVISLNLQIGEMLKSEIMLMMNQQDAKQAAQDLMNGLNPGKKTVENSTVSNEIIENDYKEEITEKQQDYEEEKQEKQEYLVQEKNEAINKRNLNLILDVPLKLSVLLGRTKKNINDILSLGPGSIVELEKMAEEPVDILVNDTLIARGEVVAVNEYFGVRITNIISPENRLRSLVNK